MLNKIKSGKGCIILRNKKIIYNICLIVTLVGLIAIISGTSYAVLKGNTSAEKEQVVQNGNVTVTLTEYFESIKKKINILSDEEGLLQEDSYKFNIKNTGDIAAKYDIKLVNEVPSDYQGETIDEKYIKVGLEINEEEYGPFSLEEVENILDSGIIYKGELISYNLRIWLDESYEEELSEQEGAKIFYKIKVEAEQRTNISDTGSKATEFNYTGEEQEYKVTRDGYYYIEMAGAEGGSARYTTSYTGGKGAKTSGYVYLEAGETLYFYVRGMGSSHSGTTTDTVTANGNGYNGGSKGNFYASNSNAGGGGGATDVRLVGGEWDNTSSLISRIMVAGGGGGADSHTTAPSYSGYGGAGGALFGGDALQANTYCYAYGKGASQSVGGTSPNCANGTTNTYNNAGFFGIGYNSSHSGGGGGYYGGAGGQHAAAAGGSSYISGYAGVNSVEESTTITHTNGTLHYSGKYFIGGKMIAGQNEGNGYTKITYVGTKPKRKTTKLNNVRYIKDCINDNSGTYHHNYWREIQAIVDGENVAKNKKITGTVADSEGFEYEKAIDGDVSNGNYAATSTNTPGNTCVTVDLGQEYDLDEVMVGHGVSDQRVYYDNITSVSSDNQNFTEIINETGTEVYDGKRVNAYTDTYNGYIQDGLVLWFDGYVNSGEGHNMLNTTWKDLSGTGNNATISGATWRPNYLSFDGVNDYARTSAVLNYNNSTSFTLQFVGTVEETDIGILFESSANSNQNNASFYIDTNEFGTSDLTLAMKYPSSDLKNHKMADNILENNLALYTIIFDSTRNYNDYILIYKNETLYKVVPGGTTSSVNGDLSNETLSNYILYIASRAGTSNFTKMNLNSLRLYNKALTKDEIIKNYLYDVQKFNLN